MTRRMVRWMAGRLPSLRSGMGIGPGYVLCLALAGCVTSQVDGPAVTRGETVLAVAGPLPGSSEVRVTSAKGWRCEGLYAPNPDRGGAVRFPMDCSDDVETTALMQVNPADGRAALLFSRKDGSSGKAAFSVLR